MVAVMLLELLLGLCRCVEVVSVGVLCVGVCRRRSVCVTTSFLFFFSQAEVGMCTYEILKTLKTSEK